MKKPKKIKQQKIKGEAMKLDLTNLTGSGNISVNINASVGADNKISASVTVGKSVNTTGNPNAVRTEETYSYQQETAASLLTKIQSDLGLGILVE